MRYGAIFTAVLVCALPVLAQQTQTGEPAPAPASDATVPETENIQLAQPAAPDRRGTPVGEVLMEPEQVKALLHKIWLAQYRLNDLLTEVHPDRWQMPSEARQSFQQTLGALKIQLESLESWRSQFASRPDSQYLGYMTYATMGTVLPRLDGVGRSITRHENASLGVQFSQAGNQFFDLQQALEPYLTFMLRNHDELLYSVQTNLANCQSELSYAMRGRTEAATPMTNVRPDFKGRRVPPKK